MADQIPPADNQPVPPPAYPSGVTGTPPPYAQAPQNGLGTAALVMGILQFFCLGPIGSVLAIVFGAIGRKKAKQGLATNGGVATAGFWLGIAGLILSVIAGVVITIGVIFGVNAAQKALDPAQNSATGLPDGNYSMDPTTSVHINNRCSYGGIPQNVDTGETGTSRVTVVGEGAAQCGESFDTNPDTVTFMVSGGVAQVTGLR